MVFVTKYRRDVLTDEHLDFLQPVFGKVCTDSGTDLTEFDGEADHVPGKPRNPGGRTLSERVGIIIGRAVLSSV